MPQQLSDLTLAEVEDLVPVVTPVFIPIFGALGLLRYPTKPVSLAVHVATISIFTYLQGSPPMSYAQMIRETYSGEVPQAYPTVKTEQQVEENMMGVVRARSRKAAVLPREYGPINWYNGPVDLNGQPFRFPWSSDFIKTVINPCLQLSPHVRSDYKFKFIQVPNRYWKEPVGYPRARPTGRGKELLDHQLRHLDVANVPKPTANTLKAMKPMSKEAIQRTRYCVMVDSTVPCDLPLDNVIPDVLVVTMPLSRLPERAEVAIALFSPEGP